jgi:hypothetical protein
MRERQLEPERLESEIEVGRNDHLHFGEGWHPLEPLDRPVRWTARSAAFQIGSNGGTTLCLTCNSYKPNLAEQPTNGRVEIEGQPAGEFLIERTEWRTLRFPLPQSLDSMADGVKLAGRIMIENPWRPHRELASSFQEAVIGRGTTVKGSRDPRLLGILVSHIWLE